MSTTPAPDPLKALQSIADRLLAGEIPTDEEICRFWLAFTDLNATQRELMQRAWLEPG
jgi:hypothetical protein